MSNEESLLATISAWPWYVSLLALSTLAASGSHDLDTAFGFSAWW